MGSRIRIGNVVTNGGRSVVSQGNASVSGSVRISQGDLGCGGIGGDAPAGTGSMRARKA